MLFSPALKRAVTLSVVFSLFISASAFADNLLITRHFSGIWDQPEQESQGIILQIGEQDGDQKVGIAYWFTYGEDLQSTWFLAVGPINGNEINMTLYSAFDVAFMGENLVGDANVVEIGTLDLVFKNCNHGVATYATEEDMIGSGEFPIKRISSIYRTRCSGGISDDTPSGGKPFEMDVRLTSAREDITGKGKAKFWEREDRSDFKVEAEDIPDGTYSLEVCEVAQAEMLVVDGVGELEFRSPEGDDKLLLSFDPRDCKIELLDIDGAALTSGEDVLEEKKTGK